MGCELTEVIEKGNREANNDPASFPNFFGNSDLMLSYDVDAANCPCGVGNAYDCGGYAT